MAKKHNKVYYIEKRRRKNKRRANMLKNEVINTKVCEINIEENKDKLIDLKRSFKKHRLTSIIFSMITSLLMTTNPMAVMAKTNTDDEVTIQFEEYVPTEEELLSYITESVSEEETLSEPEEDIVMVQEIDNTIFYDNYLKEYADYFNMNSDFVIGAARFITSDYSVNMELFNNNSYESFAISFLYSLYNGDLNEYGYYREEFSNGEENEYLNNSDINYDEFVYRVSNAIEVDPALVLAISDYETGYQSSSQAQGKNNFGGLKGSGGYMSFPTPEAGVIYLATTVKNMVDNEYIDNVSELSGLYVNGSISRPSSHWVSSVNCIYSDITEGEKLVLK